MTDIDFDELDRAVNSLMQPKQAASHDSQSTEQPTETVPNTAEYTAATKSVQPSESVTTLADNKPSPMTVGKKRGQFMDIMHASSDMKQTNIAPKLAPRRSGVSLLPSSDYLATEPDQQSKPESELKPKSQGTTSQAPVEDQLVEKAWPDPIEGPKSSSSERPPSMSAETEPLSTPFLTDAKVDKRPLGGLQPVTELSAEPVVDPDMTKSESEEANSDVAVLPAELQQDILAVETAASAETKKIATTATKSPTDSLTPAPASPPTTIKPVDSLPQGPPPQIASDTEVDTDSSIFDTEHYQAPIKHPAKRKSSWPTVLAIVALVLLGTGGGIAYYLLSSGY